MAQINLTVNDADLPDVLNAFAETHGYDPAKHGTKAAFAKATVARYIRGVVREWRRDAAIAAVAVTDPDVA